MKLKKPKRRTVRKDAVKGTDTIIIKPGTKTGIKAGRKRRKLMQENKLNPHNDYYDPNDPMWHLKVEQYKKKHGIK